MLFCQLVKYRGAKVSVVSRRGFSLAFAKMFGAGEIIALKSALEVNHQVATITGSSFCPRIIEATGKQEALDKATEIVPEGGKIIIAGYHQDDLQEVNLQKWNRKGILAINAHEKTRENT